MLALLVLVAAAGLIEAKPSLLQPTFSYSGVIGGVDAAPGEFPWQLSQQRASGSTWSHSCGASLLAATKALSAAHCVDGAAPNDLRVVAGLHQRSVETDTQSSMLTYTMHEEYGQGTPSFANDIAILHLSTAITTSANVAYATLSSGSTDFAGNTCVITGWGRTSASQTLPDVLQKASIGVISTADCATRFEGVGSVWDGHICVFAADERIGSCNGDSGGPLNCQESGSTAVSGVTSWGVSTLGICRQNYPSVYTRVSYYLDWIDRN